MRVNNKCPTDQWDEFNRFLDTESNIPSESQTFLRTILDMAENGEPGERREHSIDICWGDDCSSVEDPQCALYWAGLRGKSYVEESSSEEEGENEISRNTCSGVEIDVQASMSKKDKVEIVDKGKNVVTEDHVAVVQKSGLMNNEATKNEIEHVDRAQTHDKDKIVYKRKLSKAFKVGQEAKKRAADNSDVYQNRGPSNNRVTKHQSEHVDQAQLSKIGKVEGERKLQKKLVKGENVIMEDYVSVVQKPGPRTDQAIANHLGHVDKAGTRDKDKMVYKRKLSEVLKGGQGSNKRQGVQVENRDVYRNPGPNNNQVAKNKFEYVDQAQSSETGKVERKAKLPKKPVKGKKGCKTDHEVNMPRPVVQKPDPRNKCLIGDRNKLVHPVRPEKSPRKLKKVVRAGKNIAKEDGVARNSKIKIENDCRSRKPVSNKLRRKNVVKEEFEGCRKAVVQKPGSRNEYPAGADQSRPRKEVAVQDNRKLVKVVKKENGHSNLKTAFGTSKNQRDRNVQARSSRKSTNGNLRKAKAANIYHEKEDDDDESSSDVQILDSAAIETNGAMSAFVPSRRFERSDDESQDLGGPSTYADFRTRVLEVLNRPFDRDEYKRHRDAVRAGKYFVPYPDLKKKLKTHLHNRAKRLAILRGFFFWLQNVVQEGAFKPWKDGQCLKVEPT